MAPADAYDEVEAFESFDDLEFADEATPAPGRKFFAPGGLASATLHTPKGPAKLSLPAPVPTLAQFRSLERAVNANSQRLNAANTELARIRRQLSSGGLDQQGKGTFTLLCALMSEKQLRDALEGHKHDDSSGDVILPATSGSFLPLVALLFLSPSIFGQGFAPGGQRSLLSFLPFLLILQPNILQNIFGGPHGSTLGSTAGGKFTITPLMVAAFLSILGGSAKR